MALEISIARNGVWAGDGTVFDGEIECEAVLGRTQDDSDETYAAIMDAIDAIMDAIDSPLAEGRHIGSVTRPDGEYTFILTRA